jgi:hypothetical protein
MRVKSGCVHNIMFSRSEIDKMIRHSGMVDPVKKSPDISEATNGDQAICSPNKLEVNYVFQPQNARIMMLFFDNYQKKITLLPGKDYRALLGYQVF